MNQQTGRLVVLLVVAMSCVAGVGCRSESSSFTTVAFPDGLHVEPKPAGSPTPLPVSGECNASSFVLSSAETDALWPAEEAWHLSGFTVVCGDPGRLTFDIVEPRHGDRSIARVICEVSK